MDDLSESLAGAAQEGRVPMGNSVLDAIGVVDASSSFLHPELVRAKYQMQLQDPSLVPGAAPRSPVLAERLGASYRVNVLAEPQVLPEAAATQANGRIIPPTIVRSRSSFDQGTLS